MVTHSKSFHIALAASFAEYVIEWLFFPSLKGHTFMYPIIICLFIYKIVLCC